MVKQERNRQIPDQEAFADKVSLQSVLPSLSFPTKKEKKRKRPLFFPFFGDVVVFPPLLSSARHWFFVRRGKIGEKEGRLNKIEGRKILGKSLPLLHNKGKYSFFPRNSGRLRRPFSQGKYDFAWPPKWYNHLFPKKHFSSALVRRVGKRESPGELFRRKRKSVLPPLCGKKRCPYSFFAGPRLLSRGCLSSRVSVQTQFLRCSSVVLCV